jgi:hypothetical protein
MVSCERRERMKCRNSKSCQSEMRVAGRRVVLSLRLSQQTASCTPRLVPAYLLHLMFCMEVAAHSCSILQKLEPL